MIDDKRYQVFVSSTFTDLVEERKAVMQALLELNCIPAGMELFPASDDDQLTLIKRVIDESDYYVVIVSGRYGSIDREGISYTEREYDYAVEQRKPILGFVRQNPERIEARFVERDQHLEQKLSRFREKVSSRHVKYWQSADDLGGKVSRSMVQAMRFSPAEGWVKARFAKTTEDAEKTTRLVEQVQTLEKELAALRSRMPNRGTLAQGADRVLLKVSGKYEDKRVSFEIETTWNELFTLIGPLCIDLHDDNSIYSSVTGWIRRKLDHHIDDLDIQTTFKRIKVQFFALGLIEVNISRESESGDRAPGLLYAQSRRRWRLTDNGRILLAELLGEKADPRTRP